MKTFSFTDPWTELSVYDTHWQLVNAADAMENMARYQALSAEAGVLPSQQLPAPLKVLFELTRQCNLGCSFCYNSSSAGARNSLSDEEALRVAEELCELEVLEGGLSGGEVLTAPERLVAVLQMLQAHGIGVVIITNGWDMTPGWAQLFADLGVLSVQVSIDGADAEVHDRLRGRSGSWRRAVDAVGMLKQAGCYTAMGAIVTRQNFDSTEDYIDLAYYLGADEVLVGDIIARGRAVKTQGQLRLHDDRFEELTALLQHKARQYDELMTITLGTDEAFTLKLELSRQPQSMVIRGDGSATPSCLLPVPLGSVREQPVAEIWREGFADLAAHPQVREFLADLRVTGIGEDAVLRVVHEDGAGPDCEP